MPTPATKTRSNARASTISICRASGGEREEEEEKIHHEGHEGHEERAARCTRPDLVQTNKSSLETSSLRGARSSQRPVQGLLRDEAIQCRGISLTLDRFATARDDAAGNCDLTRSALHPGAVDLDSSCSS